MSERIVSRPSSAAYRENFDRIWPKAEGPKQIRVSEIRFNPGTRRERWVQHPDGSIEQWGGIKDA